MPSTSVRRIRRNCPRREFTHWLGATPLQPVRIGEDDKCSRIVWLRRHDCFVDGGDNFGFIAMRLRRRDQGVRRGVRNALGETLAKGRNICGRVILLRDLLQLRGEIV